MIYENRWFVRFSVGFWLGQIVIMGSLLQPSLANDLPAGFVGRLGNVQGTVLIDGVAAKEGSYLKQGSTVTTENGKCTVFLGDETAMHLDHESKLEVSKYLLDKKNEQGVLDLKYGATRTLVRNRGKINKGFFIKAKTAVMGVRGTEVMVQNPPSPTEAPTLSVVRGQAEVTMPILQPQQTSGANAPSERKVTLNSGQSVQVSVVSAEQNSASNAVTSDGVAKLSQTSQGIAPTPANVATQQDLASLQDSPNPFAIRPPQPDLQSTLTDQRYQDMRDPYLNGKHVNITINGSVSTFSSP